MSSRITGSIIKSSSSTDTAVTIRATGRFTYRSGTYGYTVDGYIQIGSSKKTFNDAKSSTSGGTFTAVSHSVTITRTRVNQTIAIKLYGYCDEGSSEDKSTVTTTVTVPALPSYAVTLDYNDGEETPIGNLTKWYGETLTLPTPARSGYTFLGWSDGTSNIGVTYAVDAAASLTAQWKINNIPPSITSKNCQRVTGDKTKAVFTIGFAAGKNADGSTANVSAIKIEYKLLSDSNWTELVTLNPTSSPITYTGGNFLETETYSIRYTISDANYSGLTATDVLTKVSYIWKVSKGQNGIDFGVPVTVNGEPIGSGGGSGSTAWSDITDKPSTFPPSSHTHTLSQITDHETLSNTEIETLLNGMA